jgi:hypothetical protein
LRRKKEVNELKNKIMKNLRNRKKKNWKRQTEPNRPIEHHQRN